MVQQNRNGEHRDRISQPHRQGARGTHRRTERCGSIALSALLQIQPESTLLGISLLPHIGVL